MSATYHNRITNWPKRRMGLPDESCLPAYNDIIFPVSDEATLRPFVVIKRKIFGLWTITIRPQGCWEFFPSFQSISMIYLVGLILMINGSLSNRLFDAQLIGDMLAWFFVFNYASGHNSNFDHVIICVFNSQLLTVLLIRSCWYLRVAIDTVLRTLIQGEDVQRLRENQNQLKLFLYLYGLSFGIKSVIFGVLCMIRLTHHRRQSGNQCFSPCDLDEIGECLYLQNFSSKSKEMPIISIISAAVANNHVLPSYSQDSTTSYNESSFNVWITLSLNKP